MTAPPFTTDRATLYAAVLAAPADDAPRLAFADVIEEAGEADRATFIRVQVELARLGPPHIQVTEPCVLSGSNRLGPGYYTLSGGEGTPTGYLCQTAKPGDRIDVLKPRGRRGPMYGLRFHKDDGESLILVNDAKAGPWPGEALRRRERELWQTLDPWELPLSVTIDQSIALLSNPHHPGPFAIVRRGFVDEIRLTAAALCGGPCGRCGGDGRAHGADRPFEWSADVDYGKCVVCRGTGRTPPLAPALAALPLTKVVLVGAEPEPHTWTGGTNYSWYIDGLETDHATLPEPLYDLLAGGISGLSAGRRAYDSREAALAALGAAALAYLRAANRGATPGDR